MAKSELEHKLGYGLGTIAVGTALTKSLRYSDDLQIKPAELKRYFEKSRNLALCYTGFSQQLSLKQAKGAGRAAFLSAAYDVVSDWNKPFDGKRAFYSILHSEVSPRLQSMAINLLDRDVAGKLRDDGLERGVVALEFVLEAMGLREIYDQKTDVYELGIALQIVDDILDYEEDIDRGDQNCLTSDKRNSYLKRVIENFGDERLEELFPYGGILTYAIKKARFKAEQLLAGSGNYKEGMESRRTQLTMIIDPDKQSPEVAASRAREFFELGGDALFVGGSGLIEDELFNKTLESVIKLGKPVFVLPGHIGQLMPRVRGLSGVFNYKDIIGEDGTSTDTLYPPDIKRVVASFLKQNKIPDIRTLYILCGDPDASVSKTTGIKPLELRDPKTMDFLLKKIRQELEGGNIECVFMESGSNSSHCLSQRPAIEVRTLIETLSPETKLIISGGIKTPSNASLFSGIADFVNIGSHFERNGVEDTPVFLQALIKPEEDVV